MNAKTTMHLWLKFISGLLLFFDAKVDSHPYDLCGMGTTGIQENTLNVNFAFRGPDSSNSNQSWWLATCKNVSLEWGGKWGYSFYILKIQNTFSIYGYCNEENVIPTDCQNWLLWNTTHFRIDHAFTIRNCSYYTVSGL